MTPPLAAFNFTQLFLIFQLPDDIIGRRIVTAEVSSLAISSTPLPAALPLFATGFGALGLLGWRRKRKAQAAA